LLQRWISADPLAVHSPGSADLNLYAYVHGRVLVAVDPVGLDDSFEVTPDVAFDGGFEWFLDWQSGEAPAPEYMVMETLEVKGRRNAGPEPLSAVEQLVSNVVAAFGRNTATMGWAFRPPSMPELDMPHWQGVRQMQQGFNADAMHYASNGARLNGTIVMGAGAVATSAGVGMGVVEAAGGIAAVAATVPGVVPAANVLNELALAEVGIVAGGTGVIGHHVVSGLAADAKALPAAGLVAKYHIFPQRFRPQFKAKGIADIDLYTVEIEHWTTHLKGVHGRGLGNLPGRWNQRWEEFLAKDRSITEIYQFAGRLMDEFGLSGLPIVPY